MDKLARQKCMERAYSILDRGVSVSGLISERLLERRLAAGLTQSELARLVGIGQSSANRLEAGVTRNPRHIIQLARVLGTTPEYLTGETDDPKPTTEIKLVAPAAPVNPDMVEIAEFNLAYGLGGAYIHDAPVEQVMRPFSKAWVRQFTQSPIEQLFWATGSGTSMMPAILDSDILLIDTGQRTPRMWDHVWAIEMHGLGMIKALRPGKDGAMRILSLNPDYPEEVAYDGEMNVIGRVVAIVRKI
jgi:phage repressor protein C with HTH and peptisase S24 domain